MKNKFIHYLNIVYNWLSLLIVKGWLCIVYAVFLLWIIYKCLAYYPAWSKVPTHYLEADVTSMGKMSSYSFCELLINVDAGGDYFNKKELKMNNRVRINNDPLYNKDSIMFNGDFKNQIEKAFDSVSSNLSKMNTFYRLDYKYYVSLILPGRNLCDSPDIKSDDVTMSYAGVPQIEKTRKDTRVIGKNFLAYGKIEKMGDMAMSTRVMNEPPSFFSPWDITQANYILYFHTQNIRCRNIKFEFIGSTSFSEMNPKPDKITVSSVEYTDYYKIKEIMNNGLRFHANFVEQEEKSSIRVFVLTAIMSLAISLFASVIHNIIFNKKIMR